MLNTKDYFKETEEEIKNLPYYQIDLKEVDKRKYYFITIFIGFFINTLLVHFVPYNIFNVVGTISLSIFGAFFCFNKIREINEMKKLIITKDLNNETIKLNFIKVLKNINKDIFTAFSVLIVFFIVNISFLF